MDKNPCVYDAIHHQVCELIYSQLDHSIIILIKDIGIHISDIVNVGF